MPIAEHLALALQLAHEHLEGVIDSGSLKDCADLHDVTPQQLKDTFAFLSNTLNNQ